MAILDSDLLPIGRNTGVYKIDVGDLTDHQKSTFIEVVGDTMKGPLGTEPPTSGTHATNKAYVDGEIQKIVDQLDDIVSQRQEGIYRYKAPGFNGSATRPPGSGEFYIYRQFNLDYTPLYESADRIVISHTSTDGSINNLADVKVGEYLQFNIAGSSDSFTYIVDAISPAAGSAEFSVTFNRKSSSSVVRPTDGEVSRLQSYHIEGIDVDDLNNTLDTRYVSTGGDVVSGTIALGETSNRFRSDSDIDPDTLHILLDGPSGVIRTTNTVEAGLTDRTDDGSEGVKLFSDGELVIQKPVTDPDNATVIDIRHGTNQTFHITVDGDLITDGDVTAEHFIGDGSQLTNLPPAGNKVHLTTTTPADAREGDLWFTDSKLSGTNQLFVYNSSNQWLEINRETYVDDVPPTNPIQGDFWFNTTEGVLYAYYVDTDSSQWVSVGGGASGGGGASVEIGDNPPSSPQEGDLWYSSLDGLLYIYYVDVDSEQWVSVGGSGGGGGASVEIGDTSPGSANDGDLWFSTTDGLMYVYYTDNSSSQWVSTSGSSGGGINIPSLPVLP